MIEIAEDVWCRESWWTHAYSFLLCFTYTFQFTPIDVERAAVDGDLEKLKIQAVMNKTKLVEGDNNDWQPIHLAARAGNVEVVEYLLKNGADVDAITNAGRGWSPLRIAMDTLGEDHEVCSLLRSAGGHAVNVEHNEL